MKNHLYFVAAIVTCLILFGCDQAEQYSAMSKKIAPSYSECLQRALAGSHNLSANDIRSLCAEAAGIFYTASKFENGKFVPADNFSSCVDKEEKELKSRSVSQAKRLALLSCKYPEEFQILAPPSKILSGQEAIDAIDEILKGRK